jgi:hypothetical protein
MLSSLLIVCICVLSAIAQSLPIRPAGDEEKPEIAYRLFSNWADNYQASARRGKTVAEAILYTGGAFALAGSALTWFGGDAISNDVNGSPMDPDLKQNLSLGLGISGGALLLSGMIVASVPIKDYRAIYADVFEEKDPEVREAMAVSVLRYQADRGRQARLANVFYGVMAPLVMGGITAGINLSQGESWDKDLWQKMSGMSWSMVWSMTSLFVKSPQEQLYERYLSARDAYYGSTR